MISRNLSKELIKTAGHYPVVCITGPRQSGKTTLCRATFPDKAYVTLELLDVRDYARTDPRGFLDEHRDGAIIDEVQHVPDLLSYLQVEVDERPEPGRFILTGSQHFGLIAAISQTLAGRSALLYLLPPSLEELRRFDSPPDDLFSTLWTGAYPRIHDRQIPAARWLADYLATYVQRDVRQVLNVGDLAAFTDFVRLCAGRSAQVLNLSALGADAGVSHNTARAWLGVLEASFICQRVPAFHRNIKKQLIRSPKIHFLDSGLHCHLLGLQEPAQLRHHPQRGAVFESWVFAELHKAIAHAGGTPDLRHFRDARGLEVDLLLTEGRRVSLVEAKSGATVSREFFAPLHRLKALLDRVDDFDEVRQVLVYGGEEPQSRQGVEVLPWAGLSSELWAK